MTSSQDQASKDVSAALADIRGRRDQVVAEFDERLRQLEELATELDAGNVDPKSAQDRVRRLIHEKSGGSGGAARPVRAGRTQIGMRLPSEATPATGPMHSSMRAPLGPSAAVATAAINKALGQLDTRIVALLTERREDDSAPEARLELALLRAVRGSLDRQLESVPEDVVLLGSIIEFAEGVQATLDDLEAGGEPRVKRLLEYDRELASQLLALGGSVSGVKDQLKRAQEMLAKEDDAHLRKAVGEALTAFSRLVKELKKHLSGGPTSLIDDLIQD